MYDNSSQISAGTFWVIYDSIIAIIIGLNLFLPIFRRYAEREKKLIFEAYSFVFYRGNLFFGGGNMARVSVYSDCLAINFFTIQIFPFEDIYDVKLVRPIFHGVLIKSGAANYYFFGNVKTSRLLFESIKKQMSRKQVSK